MVSIYARAHTHTHFVAVSTKLFPWKLAARISSLRHTLTHHTHPNSMTIGIQSNALQLNHFSRLVHLTKTTMPMAMLTPQRAQMNNHVFVWLSVKNRYRSHFDTEHTKQRSPLNYSSHGARFTAFCHIFQRFDSTTASEICLIELAQRLAFN